MKDDNLHHQCVFQVLNDGFRNSIVMKFFPVNKQNLQCLLKEKKTEYFRLVDFLVL
jgi:hypothetical protein